MKVLSFAELKSAKGIPYSRVHLRRLEAAGRFPRRVKLSGNAVAWVESEIDAWLEERAAERKAEYSPSGVTGKVAHEATAARACDQYEAEEIEAA